jgi:hypothetical protein
MPIPRVEDIPAGGHSPFFGRTAKVKELIHRLRNNFGTPKEAVPRPDWSGKRKEVGTGTGIFGWVSGYLD